MITISNEKIQKLADTEDTKMMRMALFLMKKGTRNSDLPKFKKAERTYDINIEYYFENFEQQERIQQELDQIAKRVGGISEVFDQCGNIEGHGAWSEWRQASNLSKAKLFFEAAKTHAECCAIYDPEAPDNDPLASYETEIYQRYFYKDEFAVTTHKNQNV
jgi:hypothetical protein